MELDKLAVFAYYYISSKIPEFSNLLHTNTRKLSTELLANVFGAEWLRCYIVCICNEKTEFGDDRKEGLA